MDCPDCGFAAGDAKFCPECGADMRDLQDPAGGVQDAGLCPECGADPGDAKFCPECGYKLVDAPPAPPTARSPRAAPAPPRKPRAQSVAAYDANDGRSRQQRRQAERRAAHKSTRGHAAPARPAASQAGGRNSTWLIWGGFAAAAVVVVVLVVVLGGSLGGGGGSTPAGSSSVPSVSADTSGSYSALVARANGLYDQGIQAFDKDDAAAGSAYFAAAATVYAAAWEKQADDPGVGTDYATSLFYSGQTDPAIAQVDEVLKGSPDFQTAHLNRGIFLKSAADDARSGGDSAKADKLLADAKASFQNAVSIDANSDSGKNAAEQLKQL